MGKLEEVYSRLQKNKKERQEITKMFKNDLSNSERYKEILEEMKVLRDEKKAIETEVKADYGDEMDKLDGLKIEIDTDQELLGDIALSMYVKEQVVEIIDEHDVAWYPQFKVAFKKE
ncbi:hypothetical protein COY25_03055 [Candidatus Uhrbacteria bacterium CG_4_10_14_0_2_um_filter_41_7]|uniref:Uncharacterized protein n=1 Tax=Candidatus Uhrbacteria bacterium CG_4_9_14_3_um_filter_41_35 TaxID=1975034 RepID=A0A2M7XDQ7_9BACT|nr:MAG: hypothetical protein COV92_01300 [Candidatus Uhrbacteria bacterium CG11_big_fil_rev_8_21_14_0_20_41_9]PIZ53755.1 MAG: hypothetical protein COY25_03055 [Candidatus Uhrbacteria bacterium CG_4_10_14_0_2_um_filter_41_7]PJA46009.1 MAG: hypothetical protein CO173_03995 [Candidatus Uhrbacteria bacterium CG_4_9_14_3_um_filter_41_35]